MSLNMSNIKWLWVALGVVIAFIIAYGSSVCVVSGYAGYLGFQAQGTPDSTLINEFASNNAEIVVNIFFGVGTFAGGLLAGRKAKVDSVQNGLMVGLITAIIILIISIIGGFDGFPLWTIVSILLAVSGGWLGGKLSSAREATMPEDIQ